MSKRFEAVTIPKWGIEMTQGRIAEWRYAEGAQIKAGDELVDIETDKIVNSFEPVNRERWPVFLRRRVRSWRLGP